MSVKYLGLLMIGIWLTISKSVAQSSNVSDSSKVLKTLIYSEDTLKAGVLRKRLKILHIDTLIPKPIPLYPKGAVKVNQFKYTVLTFDSLKAGDSITVNIQALDGKELREVYICNNHNHQLIGGAISPVFNDFLVLEEDGFVGVHIKAKLALFKKYVNIEVVRHPILSIKTFYQVIDTIITQDVKRELVSHDTMLVQLVDDTLSLAASLDIEHQGRGSASFTIPSKLDNGFELKKLGVWVGIGEEHISQYLAMSEEVPPEWTQPMSSPPLSAYLFEQLFDLPGEIQNDVNIYFLNDDGLKRFWNDQRIHSGMHEIKMNQDQVPYRRVKVGELDFSSREVINVSAAFKNKNKVNKIMVRYIVTGMYDAVKYQFASTQSIEVREFRENLSE